MVTTQATNSPPCGKPLVRLHLLALSPKEGEGEPNQFKVPLPYSLSEAVGLACPEVIGGEGFRV